jgi:hypothetical protein
VEHAVFVEFQPSLACQRAQMDVVLLRSGEILQRGAIRFPRHGANIHLDSAFDDYGGFGRAKHEHLFHQRQLHGLFQRPRVVLRNDQDIQIADRFPPPSQRAGHFGTLNQRDLAQLGEQIFRLRQGDSEQHALLARYP